MSVSNVTLSKTYPTFTRVFEEFGNIGEKLPVVSIIHALAQGKIAGACTLALLVLPHKKFPQQSVIEWVKVHCPKLRPNALDKAKDLVNKEDLKSYLSGHATGAFDAVGFDGLVYLPMMLQGNMESSVYVISIVAIASLVAMSRYVALKHDAYDISRGIGLGLLVGSIAAIVSYKFDS